MPLLKCGEVYSPINRCQYSIIHINLMIMIVNKKNIDNLLYIFLAAHIIIWTAVPFLTNNNLPLDTIEKLAWASNFDWGFNKHPPMSALLAKIFYYIFGINDWAYYLLSQLCVVFSFLIIWKLSKYFFKVIEYRLISVLLLVGIYFYNYTTPEFNVYISELPFWSLTVFYSWKVYKKNNYANSLLLGIFAAMGILSHYLFVYLLLSIEVFFLYMIYKKKINLRCLISLLPFLLILSPHLFWLFENNYTTISYALHRTGDTEKYFFDHILFPISFIIKQLAILIPFFCLLAILKPSLKLKSIYNDHKLFFLLIINLFPIFLIILTSVIMGVKIRTMWMTPFYLFFGLMFVYIIQFKINLKKLKSFIILFLFFFILSPFTYAFVSLTQNDKRTDYKGKEISQMVQKKLIKKGIVPKTVEGNEWIAGNLCYHLKSRPKCIIKSQDYVVIHGRKGKNIIFQIDELK